MESPNLSEGPFLESLLSQLKVIEEPILTPIRKEIAQYRYPWEFVWHLSDILELLFSYIEQEGTFEEILPAVWVAPGVRIQGSTHLEGPLLLEKNVVISSQASIIGPVYLGKGVRIEKGVEVRSSFLCEGCQVGKSSVVIDSLLSRGVILEENVQTLTHWKQESGQSTTILSIEYPKGKVYSLSLNRLGSFIGPKVKVERHTLLSPGSVILKETNI
ncbi:MAG: hypothetical protein SNJ78_06675 [Spirochaetales bacterium]